MATPLIEISGIGGALVWLLVVLTVVGIAFAVRGFWGGDPRSRRMTVLLLLLAVGSTTLFSGYTLLYGLRAVTRLGPASTMADVAKVLRQALSPAMVGVLGATLVSTIAAAGWVVRRGRLAGEEPPRRPVR